jgi:predicted phage baseplate assembly protein
VRELSGTRANVEWRILAMELLGEDYGAIQEIEDELRQEGPGVEIQRGDLRLRRDRNKRVTEAWVCWQGKPHLFFSKPNDRHYVLEHSRGRLRFGDGEQGKVPPAGAEIRIKEYRAGGGTAGNVKAGSISQLLAGIGGVEAVYNPEAAEGGADGETLPAVLKRGPQTLRHQGRALSPRDYETMAKEASASVAVARAIPTQDSGGRQRPGWVTVIIIPHSEEARPWPTFGLRDQVRRYIAARAPASVAAASQIYVTGPSYQEIDVTAVVVPIDPTEAGTIEQHARDALEHFFHPLCGGPERRGWAPGRDVFLSDVASVLERADGVDYVEELSLLLNGALQRECARVPGDRIAVAGQISIRMLVGE